VPRPRRPPMPSAMPVRVQRLTDVWTSWMMTQPRRGDTARCRRARAWR
jgi:hypothetical protein